MRAIEPLGAANQAWTFWKTMSEVSPRVVRDEMTRDFRLSIVGTEEDRQWFLDRLIPETATRIEREDGRERLYLLDRAPDEGVSEVSAATFYLAGPDQPLGVRGVRCAPFVGSYDEAMAWVAQTRAGQGVAFGRYLPGMRPAVAQRLILNASANNARFAFLSALPWILPVSLPFLPASSAVDVFVLTKNQAMLVMRLAAAHGQAPGYTHQVKEILGTVAGAMGWRLLARELAGMIPAGIGVAAKTAIAYSGTITVGKAALYYYQKGHQMTAEQIRNIHKESEAEAKAVAEQVISNPPSPEDLTEL
ncbi:hypothetical protein [Armatimonas rosea]|uniref:Uncharacterized protein (DUF697 family) n=1 Tax=Armatimonas rosea TaxID=685828 RepID=A0A7W9STD5_ARMRO|nr:hypothetical protein [Armatimonas rosea]MBB6051673.1 uncharacterized protein (DUF697 family) [Armatimonas rosea]